MANEEVKAVKLSDNMFLLSLTSPGSTYAGYHENSIILVGAVEGNFGDWAAYFETPWTPGHDVLGLGNKLPQKVAEELFPNWKEKKLRWRN